MSRHSLWEGLHSFGSLIIFMLRQVAPWQKADPREMPNSQEVIEEWQWWKWGENKEVTQKETAGYCCSHKHASCWVWREKVTTLSSSKDSWGGFVTVHWKPRSNAFLGCGSCFSSLQFLFLSMNFTFLHKATKMIQTPEYCECAWFLLKPCACFIGPERTRSTGFHYRFV